MRSFAEHIFSRKFNKLNNSGTRLQSYLSYNTKILFEPRYDKTNKVTVKTQISNEESLGP